MLKVLPHSDLRRLAVGSLFLSGMLWGTSWIGLKHFAMHGLVGLAVPMVGYGSIGLVSLPVIWRERPLWKPQSVHLAFAALAGGAANACFVTGVMVGEVVRVMLLFYLTPLWAVLGARVFLRERVSLSRKVGVCLAIAGAALVLGGPRVFQGRLSLPDWLGLLSGLFYAAQNVTFRAAHRIPLRSKTLSVFTGCGVVSTIALLWSGGHLPSMTLSMWIELVGFAGIWIGAAMVTTMFGVTHLEAGTAAVLLLFELVAAVVSATLLHHENLAPLEWIGATMIAGAAFVDATGPNETA